MLIGNGINFTDLAGGDANCQEARKLRARDGDLYPVRIKRGLWESLDKAGYLDEIGSGNIFQAKEAAIAAIFRRLDQSICARCDKRIFRECATVPRSD